MARTSADSIRKMREGHARTTGRAKEQQPLSAGTVGQLPGRMPTELTRGVQTAACQPPLSAVSPQHTCLIAGVFQGVDGFFPEVLSDEAQKLCKDDMKRVLPQKLSQAFGVL